jgi:hypothetical protein
MAVSRKQTERGSATPGQYETLLSLLERCGVMPNDLAALCSLRFGTPFYALSEQDADRLAGDLARLGPHQNRVRSWISDSVTALQGQWVRGEIG